MIDYVYCNTFGFNENRISEHLELMGLGKADANFAIDLQKKANRPHLKEIINEFYDYILNIPHFSHFLSSDNLVLGLKKTMRNYLTSLGVSFYRPAYFENRLRAGVAHVRIELPMIQYICIFNKLGLMLNQYLRKELSGEELVTQQIFLHKVLNLDLSLVTESYYMSGINNSTEIVSSEKEHKATLKDNVNQDALTGMLSRKATMSMLQQVLIDKKEKNISATIMMADINKLEAVNNNFGYSVGDYVILKLGRRIMKTVGDENPVGRYSGDKFIIFVKDKKDANDIAQKISKVVQSKPVVFNEQPISMAIRIGLTSVSENDELRAIFSRIDKALLNAKNDNGLNVVAVNYKPSIFPYFASSIPKLRSG
ncbi:MAG: diguanylate cyclase, partial [Gammaproteobacteria bacterium]|nr:diguanylate cyclase [Gammaproteobacteria bacterium]